MKKKLMIVLPVLLLALGGAYKFVLAAPPKAEAKVKIEGEVYVLGKQFLVNLDDAKFAQLTVGLVLAHDDHSTAPAGGGHGPAPKTIAKSIKKHTDVHVDEVLFTDVTVQ
jgi:flagellar FliL protein